METTGSIFACKYEIFLIVTLFIEKIQKLTSKLKLEDVNKSRLPGIILSDLRRDNNEPGDPIPLIDTPDEPLLATIGRAPTIQEEVELGAL